MALDPTAYGTVESVQARTQHFGTFQSTDDSQPTVADVEIALNESSLEIDMCLSELGFVTPVDKAAYPRVAKWLGTISAKGAAARIEAGSTVTVSATDDENLRYYVLQRSFKHSLEWLKETGGRALLVAGLPRVSGWGAADGFSVNGLFSSNAAPPKTQIEPDEVLSNIENTSDTLADRLEQT